jgi:hypothetical protein
VRIPWKNGNEREYTYTPDFLIRFRNAEEKPWLVEVKDTQTLRADLNRVRQKFRTAMTWAREKGWVYHFYTEKQIRTPLLANARFLLPYLRTNRKVDCDRQDILWKTLKQLRQATVSELISVCCSHPDNQALLLPHLWEMIALRQIECDLLRPINQHTPLWLPIL